MMVAIAFASQSLFYVALPTATAERRGVLGAIARSFRLARGARLRVLAFNVATRLGVWGSYQLLEIAVISGETDTEATEAWELYGYLAIGVQLVVESLSAVVAAVTYRALRESKEGPGTDELARTFE